MWRRLLKFIVPLLLAAAIGIGAGALLGFTDFQRGVWAASLCLLIIWLYPVAGAEPYPIVGSPIVGLFVTVLFAVCARQAFFAGMPASPWHFTPTLGADLPHFPRFLSAILSTLPAIPYAVSSVLGVVMRVGG